MKLTTSIGLVQTRLKPVQAYQLLRERAQGESFLFESVEGNAKTARYSFMGFKPLFAFKSKGKRCEYHGGGSEGKENTGNPYRLLQQKFSEFSAGGVPFLPFSGGMVGYAAYDAARLFEHLPNAPADDLNLPDLHFFIPGVLVAFDHGQKQAYAVSHVGDGGLEEVKRVLGRSPPAERASATVISSSENLSRSEFEERVGKAKEHVRSGDVFQVVLSRRKRVEFKGDALAFYEKLREINPSPYMAHLDLGGAKIICSSPEMLVRVEGRQLTTRPIAGTRPRAQDKEEDEKLKVEMLLDEKERAEHLMLVDLHRNDLARVSEYGSVKVDEFMAVEKYSHVQHIVSSVSGRLREGKSAFDALEACFPAGTVTGAPKVRAMQLIDEFEPCARGPYGGAVGYFDFSGNADFAITIRSAVVSGKNAFLQAGAGIVYDSQPEKEFFETENKMRAVVNALEAGD